jgi:hypothetical protein
MTSFVDDVHSALKLVLWIRIRIDLAYWIRIRIWNADPDPGAWELTKINKFNWLPTFVSVFLTYYLL